MASTIGTYSVNSPINPAIPRTGGDAMIVNANSAAEANALAQAVVQVEPTAWNTTNAPSTNTLTISDLQGWTFTTSLGHSGTLDLANTYTGVAGDSVTTFFTNAASALGTAAGTQLSSPSFSGGSLYVVNVVNAGTLGTDTLTVTMTPPVGMFLTSGPNTYTWTQTSGLVPSGPIGAITNAKAGVTAAISVAINTGWQIPGVIAKFDQASQSPVDYQPAES